MTASRRVHSTSNTRTCSRLAYVAELQTPTAAVGFPPGGCLKDKTLCGVGEWPLHINLLQPGNAAAMSWPRTADSSGRAGIAARRPCIHWANNASYVPLRPWVREKPGPQASSIRALTRVPLGAALVSMSALRGNQLAGVTHKPKVRVIRDYHGSSRTCSGLCGSASSVPWPAELPDDIGDPVVRQRGRPCVTPLSACHVRDGIGIARVPCCPRCSGECAHGLQDDFTPESLS